MTFSYDKTLGCVETPQGTMTLSKIFLPFFLEMFLMNLMGTVNTFTLSYFSDNAVAAVGAASQFVGMLSTFYTLIGTGASIVISHNLGAKNQETASDAVFCALTVGGILSLGLSLLMSLLAEPCMRLMHIEGEVFADAVVYFRICMRFSFFQAMFLVISSVFKSYGRPKISVCVSLGMNALNAFLNYLVVFRPIELPLHGVSGVAWCNVFSRGCSLLVMIILLFRIPMGLNLVGKSLHTLKMIKTILQVGIPGGISSLSYNISQVVTTSIIAIVGVDAISTKIYVSNLVFYVYVFGMSLGLSTSLLIGYLSGAGRYEQAYRLNLQNLKVTLLLNTTLSVLLFLFGRPLLGLFTDDPVILRAGSALLFLDIFVEIFRGFNHIEENSLRGAGDVLFPMAVSIISCWLISVLFSYILGVKLGLGLAGCWIAFSMDEAFRGINYYLRWRSRKWMKKTLTAKQTGA
ncbi:MAG: MATE family efflux transporter [Fusicatenibacter sp.]|nr:MATE family efflux transporter [Fusicatenibacter sp.]